MIGKTVILLKIVEVRRALPLRFWNNFLCYFQKIVLFCRRYYKTALTIYFFTDPANLI